MARTGRDSVQQMLRLPDGMREQIRAAAEANGRSINAEIVARLEDTLQVREWQRNPEVRDLLQKYHEATESENKALKRSIVSLEALLFQFGSSLRKAAAGDHAALELMVEMERKEAFLSKVLSRSPAFEERE